MVFSCLKLNLKSPIYNKKDKPFDRLPNTVLEIIFLYSEDVSFQIFLLVGHLTNWTGHNYLLTDNALKKTTQDVLVTCSVIVSDHNVKIGRTFSKFGRTMSDDRLLFPAL